MADLQEMQMLNQRELERQFVSIAVQYPRYAIKEAGWLPAAAMLDNDARKLWQAMLEQVNLSMTDEDAAAATTMAALQTGAHNNLLTWGKSVPYNAMPQSYAAEIVRRSYIGTITGKASQLIGACRSGDDDQVRRIVAEMAEAAPGDRTRPQDANDVDDKFRQWLAEARFSVPTGIANLDEAIGGLPRKELILLPARPSMGKTALAFQIARNIARTAKVAFFSLEMSAEALWARAACPRAGVEWRRVLAGTITTAERERIAKESQALAAEYGDRLMILDGRHTTQTIWRLVAAHGPDVVFVDHLRFVRDKHDSEVKRLGLITEELKAIAKAFEIPVVVLVQLNRAVEQRADKRPMLSDLRDSGELEENADMVLMLYRDDYYNQESSTPGVVEVWVRKNRNGEQNVLINLLYDRAAQELKPAKSSKIDLSNVV